METMNLRATAKNSSKAIWTGRIISGLCILFLLFDAIMKIIMNHYHTDGSQQLGWNINAVQPLGIVLLLSTVLYIIPRTTIIGAILLTGYLGGAIATMARINEPYYFPLVFGVLIWLGIGLRNEKLRNLVVG